MRPATIGAIFAVALCTVVTEGNRKTRSARRPPTRRSPARPSRRRPARARRAGSTQGRSEVLARHGMVATSDPLAAEAGLEILRQGGNAIDAAVATGRRARRHLAERHRHRRRSVRDRVFREGQEALRAQLGRLGADRLDAAFFTDTLKQTRVPQNGVNSATVPGAIAGYDALLSRFGTMKFKETFERAARIAEEGWGLAERRHSDLRSATNGLKADPDSKAVFLDGDQAWPLYSVISNPGAREGAAIDSGARQGRFLQR